MRIRPSALQLCVFALNSHRTDPAQRCCPCATPGAGLEVFHCPLCSGSHLQAVQKLCSDPETRSFDFEQLVGENKRLRDDLELCHANYSALQQSYSNQSKRPNHCRSS